MKHTSYIILAVATLIFTAPHLAQAQISVANEDLTKLVSIDNDGIFALNSDTASADSPDKGISVPASPYIPKEKTYNSEKPMFKVSTEKEVDKNGKDEKTKWFFEVPDSLIKRYFIAITRLAETPTSFAYSPHQEIAEGMYSFHVTPDKKFLHLKEYLATAFCDTLNLISKAVDLSNTDPVVGTFKIISHEKGVYKIDVTSFLLADKIMSLHPSIRQNYHVSYMDNNRSDIVSVHSYPGNVEIHTNRTYITSKPTYSSRDGFMTVGINTSLVLLPKQPMQMRLADPRVGFRSLSTPQFSDNQQEVDNISYIKRWRLEPKNASDATLQKSGTPIEPLKPIVFYIDPAFPKKWRPYIKEGVAEWQSAFEKAGWKNAIYALEWPENDSTLSLEDARYNVIRYIAADSPIIEGMSRACDYRSGEFINTFIYFGAGAFQDMRDSYVAYCGAVDSDSHTAMFPDELMGALIKHRVARAVAPTIGLDYNLFASSLTPTDSLRSKTFLDKYSLAPSITDDLPYNFVAQPQDGLSRQQLIPRVSDGDEWTIEWGYKPLDFTDPEAERQYLTDLTTRHLADNPRHTFVVGTSFNDPQCKVHDLGDDQPKAIEYGMKNLKLIAPHLVEWGTTNRDLHYSSLNAQHYWAQINGNILKYYVILSNNVTGKCCRPKPASADGEVYFYNDKNYVEKCIAGLFDMFGEQPKWVWADSTQNFTWVTPEKAGMGYAQILAGMPSVIMLRNLNQNIDPLEYAMRFYEFIYRNAKPNATPTLYERTMQSVLLATMISSFNPRYDTYVRGSERPACLYVIKQIQNRLQNALPTTHDKATHDHYTILLRQIEEFFTVKQ